MSTIQIAFQIVLMFFVLVSIHEWGHFYFAKRAGILVREFAIGFGPKLFSFKKGETRYTLRLLPIGGFVRMAGEDPEIIQIHPGQTIGVRLMNREITHIYVDQLDRLTDALIGTVEQIDLERDLFIKLNVNEEISRLPVHPQAMMISKGRETQIAPWNRQFGSKTVGQRALSIVAGPVMNFLLAFVLFITVVFMTGIPASVKVSSVNPGSPAEKAGLQAGDIIVSVNHEPIGTDSSKLTSLIKQSVNKPMVWVIERNQEQLRKDITPEDKGGGLVGVVLMHGYRSASPMEGLRYGGVNMVNATVSILDSFAKLATLQFKMEDLGGPVRIVEFTSEQAEAGFAQYIFWAGLLSLYLGLFNLLPFPALDGSRLVFLGFEAIRGKPVDPSRESMVHFVGFAMLMLLMIAVTYNDILRLMKG
ncbi:RIP metalloprotease RseP [Paenibacillus hamazuiensis]|uniref:RIP metalloprotease RseP n=1 Tax=Paenibacillus hamazuiensis TaxID=2936508 RepID=UPI00200C6064|nr:RIP metalloprotease RseP [Paenibacillus hamazuiensis]